MGRNRVDHTQKVRTAMNSTKFDRLLLQVGRVTRLAQTLGAFCKALAVLLAAALLAMAVDVALSLDPWALIGLDLLLLALALAALTYTAWAAYRNRFNPRRLARLIESRLTVPDNRLINAVDLAGQTDQTVSPELRTESISQGHRLAETIIPTRLIDFRRLRPAVLAAALALLLTGAALLTLPGVFKAVVPRFLHPTADLPHFTFLKFDVKIEPQKVYHSNPAVITAVLSGMSSLPDQANVIFVSSDNRKRQSLPMLRSPAGEFVLHIECAEKSRFFYIDTSAGRSKQYNLSVYPVPRFELVKVKYEYPAYTHWRPSSTVLNDDKNIRAIEGTKVTMTVKANLPLSACTMTLTDSTPDPQQTEVQLTPTEDPLQVCGSFDVAQNGRYQISLTSADGIAGNETLQGSITSVPDDGPQVEFLEPDQIVVSPAHWKVSVEVAAKDDVAVDRIVLFRGVNGWGPNPTDLQMKLSGPTYARSGYLFDLPLLGVRPGDVITYYASAYDSHPSGTHFSDTPNFVIRVIDEEEYLQYARASYRIDDLMEELAEFRDDLEALQQQRQELLKQAEALAETLAKGPEQFSPEEQKSLEDFVEAQRDYARNNTELAERIAERLKKPEIYEFEKPYKDMLQKMADQVQAQSDATDQLTKSFDRMAKTGLARSPSGAYLRKSIDQLQPDQAADDDLADLQEQAEMTEWQLRQLARADELASLVQSLAAVIQQQRQLAERLGQFRNKEQLSPAEQIRARRLAQEQAQLRDQLEELIEQMDRQSQESQMLLPNMSASVAEIVEKLREMNVLRDQNDAATLAQAGQGRYAFQAAEDAADKLETLLTQCQNPGGMAADDIDKRLGLTWEQISLSLEQLAESRGLPGTGSGDFGSGYYGSRTNVRLLGPHSTGQGREGPGERGTGRDANPQSRPRGDRAEDPEQINPEQAADRSDNVQSMPGVPIRFRGLVEEYFRRLADESK